MVNTTHLKVLLKKDFLTLWRNTGFLIAFAILPIGLMIAFAYIQSLVDLGPYEGTLLSEYFRYTSNLYTTIPSEPPLQVNLPFQNVQPYADIDPDSGIPNEVYMSDIQKCAAQNQGKYYYSKIAVIADDDSVKNDAVQYFTDYVFKLTGLSNSGFVAEGFNSQDDAFDEVKNDNEQPFCFAVYFQTFDVENMNFKIQYSFNKNSIPDTNLDDYNELILAPDINSWGLWFDSGAVSLYPYMNEFIARSIQKIDMS